MDFNGSQAVLTWKHLRNMTVRCPGEGGIVLPGGRRWRWRWRGDLGEIDFTSTVSQKETIFHDFYARTHIQKNEVVSKR